MPHIDTSSIPSNVVRELVKPIYESALRFFEDPANMQAYEEWLIEYRKTKGDQ